MITEIEPACGETSYAHSNEMAALHFESILELIETVTASGSYYYLPHVMDSFGETVSGNKLLKDQPGFIVARQGNAPSDDMRFKVTVWVVQEDGKPDYITTCYHSTRSSAEKCAKETYQQWTQSGVLKEVEK